MPTDRIRLLSAAVLDLGLVLVFAAIGRASHDEGHPVTESLTVAWPFLVGAAVGWAVSVGVSRRDPSTLVAGVPVWLGAVVVGMCLRATTGRGVAVSFVVVALVVLGLFLLGWRATLQVCRHRMHR